MRSNWQMPKDFQKEALDILVAWFLLFVIALVLGGLVKLLGWADENPN